MEEFNFINPTAALAPFIKYYWLLKTVGDETSLIRTVPTGMISLIFHRGNRLLSVSENEYHPQAFFLQSLVSMTFYICPVLKLSQSHGQKKIARKGRTPSACIVF